jgi:hypothetical protein
MQNELAAYQHATSNVEEMARKYSAYTDAPLYRKVQENIRLFLDKNFPQKANSDVEEKCEKF